MWPTWSFLQEQINVVCMPLLVCGIITKKTHFTLNILSSISFGPFMFQHNTFIKGRFFSSNILLKFPFVRTKVGNLVTIDIMFSQKQCYNVMD
jgi:hypothetical protein